MSRWPQTKAASSWNSPLCRGASKLVHAPRRLVSVDRAGEAIAGQPRLPRRLRPPPPLPRGGGRLQAREPPRELGPRATAERRVCPRRPLLDGIHRDERLSRDPAVPFSGGDGGGTAAPARRQPAGGASAAAD